LGENKTGEVLDLNINKEKSSRQKIPDKH